MDRPTHEPSQDIAPLVTGLSLDLSLSLTEAKERSSAAISPFMRLSSELEDTVAQGIRGLDGWTICNFILGPSTDISTEIETVEGGVLRIVLTLREVPEGLSEEEIVAYVLSCSNSGIIEYFAPDSVNEARQTNPSEDTKLLIDMCDHSTWTQIGTGFSEHLFQGDPAAYLIGHAQFIYADRQIEAFTHFNEVLVTGRAAFGDGNTDAICDHIHKALGLYEDAVGRMIRGDYGLLEGLISEEEIEAILTNIKLDTWMTDIRSSRVIFEDETLELIDRINQATANFKSYGETMSQIRHRLEMYITVGHKTYKDVWNEGVVEVFNHMTSLDEFGNLIGLEGTYEAPGMASSLEVAIARAALLEFVARQPQIISPAVGIPVIDRGDTPRPKS